MKKFYLILLFVPFFCFSNLHAQTLISGVVTEASTGEPAVGVNIIVKELQKGTITDDNGNYEFTLPNGKHTLIFSYMGFTTIQKRVNCNKTEIVLNATLKKSLKQIEEVKVTAKSEAREIREKAMPISVITMKEIEGTVSDVSGVLSKVSGIKIRETGGLGSATRINVRGLEGKRIGFFINETPIGNNTDFIDINDIPVDLIDRIEVYKGIVPAKFGGSAVGGAVNIVIKEYPPTYMDASYAIQSFNTHKISTVFKRNKNGYELGGGGFYTYSDNDYEMESPLRPGEKIIRDHDKFKKIVVALALTSENWWFDEVEIEMPAIRTEKEIQGIESNIQHAKYYADAYVVANKNKKHDFLLPGLDLNMSNVYAYSIYRLIDTSMHKYGWDGEKLPAVSGYGGEIGKQANYSYNQKHTLMHKTNLEYIINEKNSINWNTQYQYAYAIPEDTLRDRVIGYQTNFNSTMNSVVTGLSYEFNPNKKITNAITVKYYSYTNKTTLVDLHGMNEREDVDKTKADYGISEAFRYRFTPEFLIKTSLAYDVRLPSETELLGDGFMISPAGNLDPERNTNFNIGFMFDRTNHAGNRFQYEINGFAMHLEDMIRFVPGPLSSIYQNFGKMNSLGVESEVKWDATKWLYLWGNITYQHLTDAEKSSMTYGERMPHIPWFFINGGFEAHKENVLGGTGQNTRLFVDCSFIEEYFYGFEQSIYDEFKVPRSLVFNAGIEHSLKNQSIYISLQANNITDELAISEFQRPLMGRNFGLKLRYVMK